MATENYVRDLSQYLKSGTYSDLTLRFGEKIWQIHKNIACAHSKWFHNAVNIGFEESKSGLITLKDDEEFADAIACMVSYFYDASYNTFEYPTDAALLHAQVAIIADKYGCASLYELASTSFAACMEAKAINDWIIIAGFVYDHTTPEVPSHRFLRSWVVSAVVNFPSSLKTTLENEGIEQLLRSSADLATDLLIGGIRGITMEDNCKSIFVCKLCHYGHAGSLDCPNLVSEESGLLACPECRYEPTYEIETFECPSCNRRHNIYPVSDDSD